MGAENLRWVFYAYHDNVTYFLADENNKALGFPFLRHLSTDERKLLEDFGIRCVVDPNNFCFYDVELKEYSERVEITAPLYIEVRKGNEVEFRRAGTYTDEWTNLRDYQFVNETILANIPEGKIHIAGNYVPVSE